MEQSLKNQAYAYIKGKIISLEYKPNTIISESALLKELDMSRTPVRESLITLERENFVQIMPKRGILIKPISITDVNMIYDSRLLIEPFLLKNYSNYIDLGELRDCYEMMKKAEETGDSRDFFAIDDRFHRILCMSGPNTYLTSALDHIYNQSQRIRILSTPNVGERYSPATAEHLKLCEAILDHDIERAVQLLTEHLHTSKSIAISSLMNFSLPI
ncbi:MAG: GntR family transcriptional regulator [Lachnospiraceae bacterium]|nr:GntR family transcriptional regulator [Lachnospiraceae bacterium]